MVESKANEATTDDTRYQSEDDKEQNDVSWLFRQDPRKRKLKKQRVPPDFPIPTQR